MLEYNPRDYKNVSPVTDLMLNELEKVNARLEAMEKEADKNRIRFIITSAIACIAALAAILGLFL